MKIKAMEETWDPALSTNVWIAHADCREEAEKLKAEVEKHFPTGPLPYRMGRPHHRHAYGARHAGIAVLGKAKVSSGI